MSINLKILCHGMIAYVPSTDGKRMAAILCKAPNSVVPNQAAFVRFPKANYSGSNTRTAIPAPNDAPGALRDHAHVLLNKERLTIVANSSDPLTIDMFKDPLNPKETPTGRDVKSFYWMPDIDKLTGGEGDIKAEHLASKPTSATPPVLARIDFTQGKLGTTGVEKVRVPFKRPVSGSVDKLAMAREAVLELKIDANEFVLKAVKFDGTEEDLKFTGAGSLEIVIGNEPTADIYKETPPVDPLDVLADRARGEFDLYYQMLRQKPADAPLPHVLVRPGLHTFCSGGRYAKSADVKG